MTRDPSPLTTEPRTRPASADREDAPAIQLVERQVRHMMREMAEGKLSIEEARRSEEGHVDALLLQILEAMDAFDRVFRAIHDKQEDVTRQMKIWIGNFRTVKRLLEALLEKEGVKPVENLQGGFDPHWHKVADTVTDPSRAEGTIVGEARRGYVRGKKMLRKSEVVVVKNTD